MSQVQLCSCRELITMMDDIIDGIDGNQKEVPKRCEALRKVLEEFEKGHSVSISDVVYFVRELNGPDDSQTNDDPPRPPKPTEDEIEENIRHTLKFDSGTNFLTMNQFMEFLSNELQIDKEEEILKAFEVFDKDRIGVITLAELLTIMEERGDPLKEEEMTKIKSCAERYIVLDESEQEIEGDIEDGEKTNIVKDKKNANGNDKTKGILRGRKSSKSKGNAGKSSKDSKHSKGPKDETDKSIKGPKDPNDIKVNYREYVKWLVGKIAEQEKELWGEK